MADTRKSITFQAKLDASEFGPTIENMKKQFNEAASSMTSKQSQGQAAARLSQQGFGGLMSVPKPEEIQKSRRAMDIFIREQAQWNERLYKLTQRQAERVERLSGIERSLLKGSEDQLKVKERLAAAQERLNNLEEIGRRGNERLNQALDIKGDRSMLGKIGGAKGAMTLLAGGLGVAAGAVDQIGNSRFRTQINAGSAVEGTLGRSMQDMRSPFGQSWMAERAEAASEARKVAERSKKIDLLLSSAGAATIAGGAMSGNIVGAGAGLAVGGAAMMGTARLRARNTGSLLSGAGDFVNENLGGGFGAGNWLKDQGKQQMSEYNSILAREFAENFQKALTAKQQLNPLKQMASQDFDQNYMGYLQSQRAMGLNFQSFHGQGGFRERAINAGFTDQMGMQMGNDILQAGGSTRMAQNSVFGLQAQRQFALTNAPQVLGKLSGGLGSAERSESATIKILAEGMRLGLDDSKFVEENRRFTEAAAAIIGKEGAGGDEDIRRLAASLGNFVADKTTGGIAAAESAREKYQEISSTTAGPTGVMRQAGFMQDEKLKTLPTRDRQALMNLREEDINENNLTALSVADELGISVDELSNRVSKVNKGSISRFKDHDEAMKVLQKKGINVGDIKSEKDFQALDPEARKALQTVSTTEEVENPMGTQESRAFIQGQISPQGRSNLVQGLREGQVTEKMTAKGPTQEDQAVANVAEAGRLALESFQRFHAEITPSLQVIRNWNQALIESANNVKNMSESEKTMWSHIIPAVTGVNQGDKP